MSNLEVAMGGKWMTMNNFVDKTMIERAELARKRATELRALANQAQKNANAAAAIAKNLNEKAKAEEGKSRKSKKQRKNRKATRRN